jgi:hypothetical protein
MNTTLSFTTELGYNALYQPVIQQTGAATYPILRPYVTFVRRHVRKAPRKSSQ